MKGGIDVSLASEVNGNRIRGLTAQKDIIGEKGIMDAR